MNGNQPKTRAEFQNEAANAARNIIDNTIGGWLARKGAIPNIVTLLGSAICVTTCVVAAVIQPQSPWIFLLVFVVYGIGNFFDGIDGSVAKMAVPTKKTNFGEILDSTTDRVVDCAMIGAIAKIWMHDWRALAIVFVVGGFMAPSFCRARAEKLGLEGKAGFYGDRFWRQLIMAFGALGSFISFWAYWLFDTQINIWTDIYLAMYVAAALAWITAVVRTRTTRQQLIKLGTP